ncbi:MAG: hypothetical protein JNL64_04790 [Blastocatellia bacterium]|nr:hypothetical protein [Blastocatellia bacterium]
MLSKKVTEKIEELVSEIGERELISALENLIDKSKSRETELTIIANEGIHLLPTEYQRGLLHVVSRGSLDFSSITKVKLVYEQALIDLCRVLKSNSWKKIYLVPFGHQSLSVQIKLLVFRITGMETIDLFHLGEGRYVDLEIKQRDLIVKAFNHVGVDDKTIS